MNKVNAVLQANTPKPNWLDVYVAIGAVVAVALGIAFS